MKTNELKDTRAPTDTRARVTDRRTTQLQVDLRHPYAHPQIRAKAEDIMEDIDNLRMCVNACADRHGWNDRYVREGIIYIQRLESLYDHFIEQLAV